ncbi:gamma-glutamylcyclotransferase family protein [Vineibacter terrae]|nr:gamma-glutamylcyclotransferase family protein [Vineibacter terrae]
MRFFFYGTLMDRDVLARVLGRPVIVAALKPATLRGYRRTAIREGSYPIVLREPAGFVDGLTLDNVSKAESERLAAYEGPRYSLVRTFAEFPERRPRAVFLFEPVAGAFTPTDTDWSLATWQARDKEKFLAALLPVLSSRAQRGISRE